MGLPGAGAKRKDLASACVLCPCPGPLSYLTQSPIAEATRRRKGFGVPERRGVVWES
jgi:hypothetical protein